MNSKALTYPNIKPITIDPYTRFIPFIIIGVIIAIYGAYSKSRGLIYLGNILTSLGAIQMFELRRGAKIVNNEYNKPITVLHETEGAKELLPHEIPDYRIDGLTTKDMNGIFKAINGIYLTIDSEDIITETFGIGKAINRSLAGFKDKNWIHRQEDKRWEELYNLSL